MNRDFGGPTKLGMIIIGVIFFLLVAGLFFFITGGDRTADNPNAADEQRRQQVTNINSGRSLRMTVYGPVVANEERESYEISVTTTSRRFTAYKGYSQSQVASSDYDNTYEAYQQFAYALARAGFDKTREVSADQEDDRGACATGKRYVYELFENGTSVKRIWTTNCNNVRGTYGGTNSVTYRLFQSQIPEFDKTIRILKTVR